MLALAPGFICAICWAIWFAAGRLSARAPTPVERLEVEEGGKEKVGKGIELTVVIAENEDENGLEAEEVEDVPRETGHPSHVQIPRHDSRLQHRFEADSEGKGKLHCNHTIVSHSHPQNFICFPDKNNRETY